MLSASIRQNVMHLNELANSHKYAGAPPKGGRAEHKDVGATRLGRVSRPIEQAGSSETRVEPGLLGARPVGRQGCTRRQC